jgi:AcrR family transcriptional regulator
VLDAALDLFAERGFAGTSIRDLAERVGMTKASLYYHFASKQVLLVALVQPAMDELTSCALAAESASQPPERLIRRLVDLFDDHRHVLHGMLHDVSARRVLIEQHHVFDGLSRLERALARSADPADLLRARCAIGAIRGAFVTTDELHASTLNLPPTDGVGSPRPALSESGRVAVTAAAVAALGSGKATSPA